MKKMIFGVLSLVSGTCLADIDQPDVRAFYGTGYATNGWFSYEAKFHSESSENNGVLFDKFGKFLLSPRYDAWIRKVVLKVRSKKAEPTRYLRLWPFVEGVDVGTNAYDCAVRRVAQVGADEFVSFDFRTEEAVDAVRIGLDGSGSDDWRVAAIYVVYGKKTEEEEAFLKQFASELPPPGNFRIDDFGENELRLASDPVADAAGYRFEVVKLVGMPRTEEIEHFVQAPEVSSKGWSIGSGNAKLESYQGGTTPDTHADDGIVALRIGKKDTSGDVVWVDVVTDCTAEPITEVSYIAKAGATNKSDRVILYGRTRSDVDEWKVIGETNLLTTTTKRFVTNAVPESADIRQVKFRFEAESDAFTVCALDTLRVVYGGNEQRVLVETAATNAEPHCELTGLETGRYACRVRALGGGNDYRDSSWAELPPLDLAWAGISVTVPTNVCLDATGGKLSVSWDRVPDADHYLVTVVSADDPDLVVVRDQKVTGSTCTVSVPAVGEYVATVTAVSPGGKSCETSEAVTGEVMLDEMKKVTAVATDKRTIVATWDKVPLAECYQATLVRVGGVAELREYGWQADENGIALPEGWTHEKEWVHNKWMSGDAAYPSLPYTDCYLESDDCGRPVTRVVCRYKCGSTAKATLDATRFEVSVADASGDWTTVARCETGTSLGELTLTFPATQDVRRVRFAAQSESKATMGDVDLGKVTIFYGEETREEVSAVSVTKGEVTFGGLDPVGRYRVEVSPQPSEKSLASSATIDLAAERFREEGAVPLSSVRSGLYVEDFHSLSNVTADTEVRKVMLDHWQFFKGSGAAEKLLYTAGTNRTTGGVYAFADTDREADPYRLGTLATSTMGSSFGIAFRNDGETSAAVSSLSFDMIQRSFRARPQTYVLEWLVTDGATGIGTEGGWRALVIPVTAPDTAETQDGRQEVVRQVSLNGAELSVGNVPAGGVLIFRWRHEKVASGPMMAIDNVEVGFERNAGFRVLLR